MNSSKRVKVSGFPTSGSALILTTSYNRSESQLGDRFGNLHFKNYGGDLAHDRAVTATEHTGGHTQHLGQAPITAVQFSHSVMSDSETPWTAAHQASLSITNSRSLLKLMSIKSVMPSNHLILCPFFSSCLQPFPASGSFQ